MRPTAQRKQLSGRILRPGDASFSPAHLTKVLSHSPHHRPEPAPEATPSSSQQAHALIQNARLEAERIIQQARLDAEAEIQRRCAEALARIEQQERQAFSQAASELLRQIESQWQAFMDSASRQIATLALEIAGRIIRQKLETDTEAVLTMAREVLSKLTDAGKIRLVLSPEDADRLSEYKARLLAALPPGSDVEIVADQSLQRGDIVVQSEAGEIDARIQTQLASIADTLRQTTDASSIQQAA